MVLKGQTENQETSPRSEDSNPRNFDIITVDQSTLGTDWKEITGQIEGKSKKFLSVLQIQNGAELYVNQDKGDPIPLVAGLTLKHNPITRLWVRNTETFPGSRSDRYMKLILSEQYMELDASVQLFKEIFRPKYNWASETGVNSLTVELDRGRYPGHAKAEMWIEASNYGSATPKVWILSSSYPIEDGGLGSGEKSIKFCERFDYESNLNPQNQYHDIFHQMYRFVYASIDFGEDSNENDYTGDASIEVVS